LFTRYSLLYESIFIDILSEIKEIIRISQYMSRILNIGNSRQVRFWASGLFGLLCLIVTMFSTAPIDIETQFYCMGAVIVVLLVLRQFPPYGIVRISYLSFSAFVVLRYLMWRTDYTIGYHDLFSFVGALALYFAEVYGITMFFLSLFVNAKPIERKEAVLPDDSSRWPTVDVLIPTYDEEIDLVKITLAAAACIDYPERLLKIYLLDDGGTHEKLTSSNPDKASLARRRSHDLKELCAELGVHYLTREHNHRAKCGNLNSALSTVNGDLLLVLDADHVATVDILQRTVGNFLEDERLFLVQTPHFFLTPDPIEKNLETFQRMPSENRMFYGGIQPGLDFWESSFFCGSAALIRRVALEGHGFSGDTITEDAETALKLHSQGWRSRYMSSPLISGLQPQTFSSFMIQRIRWAQGMIQIFVLKNPLTQPGLRIWQRLCYLSSTLFWFFPFARVVFLVAPSLYLLFGLKIYDANVKELIGYTLPYLVCLVLMADYLFGKQRWSMVSELYETMQSLFSLQAVVAVLFNPHAPKFAVTPKSETLDENFISPLSKPFYWFTGFTVLAFLVGLWRYQVFAEDRGITLVTLLWSTLNLLLLVASLGALYELRQRRTNPRLKVNFDANLMVPGRQGDKDEIIPVSVLDISMGGASLAIKVSSRFISADHSLTLQIVQPMTQKLENFNVLMVADLAEGYEQLAGIRFEPVDIQEYKSVVMLVHGNSNQWHEMTKQYDFDPGIPRGISFLVKSGINRSIQHFVSFIPELRYKALRGVFSRSTG